MRVRIDSLGCRLNIGEADALARILAARGHRVVGPGDAADLMVLNSCAVTHVAARKSRKLIRHWRRANPEAALVITGCYAELSPTEVANLGVDLVVSNADKDRLPALLESAGLIKKGQLVPAPDADPLQPDATCAGRTRAFVKVQDGCDNRCTFCIVTVARGDARSRPVDAVVEDIRRLTATGHQEAVLCGVHLGSYGQDSGGPGIDGLVRAILGRTGIRRLRLSSLEPWDLDDDFFSLWEDDDRLLPHVHLPLQSGCDETLRRMARRTDQVSFRRLVEQARYRVPDLSVTTDIMVGFPGETDEEFDASIAFVREMQFAKLHVFRYSARQATAAATMPGRVAAAAARERSNRMHELGEELARRFRSRFIGRTLPVLWESAEPRPEGLCWSGLSDNYIRVVAETPTGADLTNTVTDTVITSGMPGALAGTPRIRPASRRAAV